MHAMLASGPPAVAAVSKAAGVLNDHNAGRRGVADRVQRLYLDRAAVRRRENRGARRPSATITGESLQYPM